MKKGLLILILTILTYYNSNAQIPYDTVLTTKVAQGITYMKILAPTIPWSINVLKIDLKNPYNKMETKKAQDHLIGQETVSSMAIRSNSPNHAVVGAVNGDFFEIGPGIPIGTQVENGQIVHTSSNWYAIGFNVNNIPMIDNVSYSGIALSSSASYPIANNNTGRGTNQLILYNQYYGDSTATNSFGTELAIKPLKSWLVNDTIKCIIVNKAVNVGNMIITDSAMVLSGNGNAATFLNNFNIGDTISVVNIISPILSKLNELIGGNLKIVNNGNLHVDNTSREPRTAAGISKDSTTLYLITVDGRQNASVGMTYTELSDFMIKLGVYQGINLDGGGSTTMVVRDSVVNVPSQFPEREDANALFVVSTQPTGTLHSIQISPNYFKLFYNETLQFNAQGRDEYFGPAQIDTSLVQYSLSGNIGTITSSGLFTAGSTPGSGYVIANYNGFIDSARIIIKAITKIEINPKNVVVDSIKAQSFQIYPYDSEGILHPLPLNYFKWISSNPIIGEVDSMGVFHGKENGTVNVIASYDGISDTAIVMVVINKGIIVIDSMENLNDFTFSGLNLDNTASGISIANDQFTQGSGSLRVDYKFTYNSSQINYVYLNTNIPINGVPDSMMIDVKSNGYQHQLYYILTNGNGVLYQMYTNKYATRSDSFDTLYASFGKVYPVGTTTAPFFFPATIKQIVIKLGSTRQANQIYTGPIYLDNWRVSYPVKTVTGILYNKTVPDNFKLYQNYPNPFNPSTTINYSIPKRSFVLLKVYDILGNEIATLVNGEENAGNYSVQFNSGINHLASGIYFYKLQAGEFTATKKLILLK